MSNFTISDFTTSDSAELELKSVLEAIKEGVWGYEPIRVDEGCYPSTLAMPGTCEKLSVMAARVEAGLPLWHGHDKTEYNDLD